MDSAQVYAYQEPARRRSISPSQSEIRLVPYADVGDEWSLPDEFVMSLWPQMADEGVLQRVFYDGQLKSAPELMAYLRKQAAVFFFEGSEPLGFAWLNAFHKNHAFAHFCGLRAARGKTEAIGKLVVGYWFSVFDFLDVILGLTPENNPLAVRFIQKIGFTVLGSIPGIVYDAYRGERVGGTISYRTR